MTPRSIRSSPRSDNRSPSSDAGEVASALLVSWYDPTSRAHAVRQRRARASDILHRISYLAAPFASGRRARLSCPGLPRARMLRLINPLMIRIYQATQSGIIDSQSGYGLRVAATSRSTMGRKQRDNHYLISGTFLDSILYKFRYLLGASHAAPRRRLTTDSCEGSTCIGTVLGHRICGAFGLADVGFVTKRSTACRRGSTRPRNLTNKTGTLWRWITGFNSRLVRTSGTPRPPSHRRSYR
jgi:hypothetical protein